MGAFSIGEIEMLDIWNTDDPLDFWWVGIEIYWGSFECFVYFRETLERPWLT